MGDMKLDIKFSLVCEGTSDSSMVDHIKTLLVECGASSASGECPDLSRLPKPPGNTIKEKVDAVLKLESRLDIIFVHRDADAVGVTSRQNEIISQTSHVNNVLIVPVVPNKMTEAWLLLDKDKIITASGNRKYRGSIVFPTFRNVEDINDPKDELFKILRELSGLSGRKLDKFNSSGIKRARRYLLQNLDVNGDVSRTPSYECFKEILISKLRELTA